jgi:predicted nucleotidyltransferase component of viral defense system
MISKQQLNSIAVQTGLSLYQQEKDYLLKLFLFFYYKQFEDAIFKGGTFLKYIFGLDRFSEDLDFNTKKPKVFKTQVHNTIQQFAQLGIHAHFRKEELFPDAYTCEIVCSGPLSQGTTQTQNKFRIDAGYRTGTMKRPEWRVIQSEYPETTTQFLVHAMHMEEVFAEKILALLQRNKGRDLYDVWYMMHAGITFNKDLFEKKARKRKMEKMDIPSKQQYERDMTKLTSKIIPYTQVQKDIYTFLEKVVCISIIRQKSS